MKRIINGLTYNTATSTLLARAEWQVSDPFDPHDGRERQAELYQTRGGAFFLAITTEIPADSDRDARQKVEFEVMTDGQAREWMLGENDVEVFKNPFEDPPEAGAEQEPGTTIYLRVPPALKKAVADAAEIAGISLNEWAIRCFEQGAKKVAA